MNTEFIPLPPTARKFFLRGDFAFELCFEDFAKSRAARKAIMATFLGNGLPSDLTECPLDDDLARLYKRPRFFIYCGAIMKNSRRLVYPVGDGQLWMPAPGEGLFADLLRRTNSALNKPATAPSLIALQPPETAPAEWLFPPQVILHDTAVTSAAIVPYGVAQNYLAMNRVFPG